MAVGGDKMLRCEFVLADIIDDGLLFGFVKRAAIDDDALFGFIAHNVAIFLEHVAHKTFDVEHV